MKGLLSAFLLFSLLFVPPLSSQGANLSIVEGIVVRVSGTAIELGGKTYDVGKARISNASGKELPISEIARGKKVNLFVVKGKIDTVIVYPTGMVE